MRANSVPSNDETERVNSDQPQVLKLYYRSSLLMFGCQATACPRVGDREVIALTFYMRWCITWLGYSGIQNSGQLPSNNMISERLTTLHHLMLLTYNCYFNFGECVQNIGSVQGWKWDLELEKLISNTGINHQPHLHCTHFCTCKLVLLFTMQVTTKLDNYPLPF